MGRLLARVLLALAIAMAFAGKALSQDISKPVLLIASQDLQGPFAGMVLHATPFHGGHIGLILNRPSTAMMGAIFPSHAGSQKVTDPIFIGGFEAADTIFAVARADAARDKTSLQLMEGVWLERAEKVIDSIIDKTPNEARYFVGFVAWRPGMLADELERGFWIVRPARAAVFFDKVPGTLYLRLGPLPKGQVPS